MSRNDMDEAKDSTRTNTVISPSIGIYNNPSAIRQQPGLDSYLFTTRLAAGQAAPVGSPPTPQMSMGTTYEQLLGPTDGVVVKQLTDPIEITMKIEVSNKYQLYAPNGQLIGMAFEQASILSQNLLRPQTRGFDMVITDTAQREVMRMNRPQTTRFMGSYENSEISVVAYPGEYAGRVQFVGNTCCGSDIRFDVLNHNQEVVFSLTSPDGGFWGSQTFNVEDINGQKVGEITKIFSGVMRELFTDSDTFRIAYPRDLDARMKSVLLGATFLIDFMFFERNAYLDEEKRRERECNTDEEHGQGSHEAIGHGHGGGIGHTTGAGHCGSPALGHSGGFGHGRAGGFGHGHQGGIGHGHGSSFHHGHKKSFRLGHGGGFGHGQGSMSSQSPDRSVGSCIGSSAGGQSKSSAIASTSVETNSPVEKKREDPFEKMKRQNDEMFGNIHKHHDDAFAKIQKDQDSMFHKNDDVFAKMKKDQDRMFKSHL